MEYMSYIYKKHNPRKKRVFIRYAGLCIFLSSFLLLIYIIFPLVSWKFYLEPVFASNVIHSPIPKSTVLNSNDIQTLLSSTVDSLNIDYTNARNWFPQYQPKYQQNATPAVITTFNISIPKLKIRYANVSTVDTDLSKYLILYPGTPTPPNTGNAVIFGHSTLTSLFKPQDYKTIFATLHKIKIGDEIYTVVNAKEYRYKVISIAITTPHDTTIFAQDSDGSYLTLITCTPPGTTWQRLIVKAKLES